jgi:hypothetical protein
MNNKKFDTVNTQHSEISDRIVDDLKGGIIRRHGMKTLRAGDMLASTAGDLLTHADTLASAESVSSLAGWWAKSLRKVPNARTRSRCYVSSRALTSVLAWDCRRSSLGLVP